MKQIFLVIIFLYASSAFSQKFTGNSKQQAAMDTLSNMLGKLGTHPDWIELRRSIEHKYPYISADSSISILKISHYIKDMPNLEPILLQFLQKYGKSIPLAKLNGYAWRIFLKSTDQQLMKVATELFSDRLKSQVNSQTVANWYDTYASLLYKIGRKGEAMEQQMKAYNMLTGNELMVDVSDGSMIAGAQKADFLITAFKMVKGIHIWEGNKTDSVGINLKKDIYYWKKLKGHMLVHYSSKQVDSLIAFTQMRYYKLNRQWSNYTSSLINYVGYLDDSTLEQKNTLAWQVFLYSNYKRELQTASNWLKEGLKDIDLRNISAYIDTYANLLYKAGKKKEAKLWLQKAVENAPEKERAGYIATLKKMENGEPTW